MTAAMAARIPDHVPPELVRDFSLAVLTPTSKDPFDELIAEIHRGPDVFYATNVTANAGQDAAWVFRRGEDMLAVFRDEEHFQSSGAYGGSRVIGETWDAIPVEIDAPNHTWYRNLLNPMFSPKRMAAAEARIRELAVLLINRVADNGECDFVRDFAIPFPVGIFLELFGLPVEDMDLFVNWEHMMIHAHNDEERVEGRRATLACLSEALLERGEQPRDDVLSGLVNDEHEGRKLTHDEAIQCSIILYQAGLDTVTSSLAWHFKHLATHPDHQRRLRDDPELIPQAVGELMRAFSPVTVPRVCKKDYTTRSGVTIKAGERVLLPTPVAGRDPELYPDPNEIQFEREIPNFAFGMGRHRCLGSHLARRELQIGIDEFLKRIPTFGLTSDKPLPMYFGTILGLASLPLTWA